MGGLVRGFAEVADNGFTEGQAAANICHPVHPDIYIFYNQISL